MSRFVLAVRAARRKATRAAALPWLLAVFAVQSGEHAVLADPPPPRFAGAANVSSNHAGDTACASVDPARPLRLVDAVSAMLCRHPGLRRAMAVTEEQRALLEVGRAAYWPVVNANFSRSEIGKKGTYEDTSFPGYTLTGASNDRSLSLTWILFDSGLRSGQLQSAKHLLGAALADEERITRETVIAAAEVFYKARFAITAARSAVEAERLAAASVQAIEGLVGGGIGSSADLYLARNTQAQMTLRRIQATSDRNTALADLSTQIGLPRHRHPTLAETDDASPSASGQDVEALLVQALKSHPKILASRHQVQAAKAREAAAKADGKPVLSLRASTYNSLTPLAESIVEQRVKGRSVGLHLSIPLFDGFAKLNRHRAAMAQSRQSMADLDAAHREVETEIWNSYEAWRVENERLAVVDGLYRNADQGFQLARGRYKAGVGSILELLKTQSELADADLQRHQVHADLQAAKLRLAVALGDLEAVPLR